jgi:hypothetical protein
LIDPAAENDKEVTGSQVTLRSHLTLDDASKIGVYTCMAQGDGGGSGSASVTLRENGSQQPRSTVPMPAREYDKLVRR